MGASHAQCRHAPINQNMTTPQINIWPNTIHKEILRDLVPGFIIKKGWNPVWQKTINILMHSRRKLIAAQANKTGARLWLTSALEIMWWLNGYSLFISFLNYGWPNIQKHKIPLGVKQEYRPKKSRKPQFNLQADAWYWDTGGVCQTSR
jgi:hypothetical protein